MIQLFWILISIGFGILTVITYMQYRRLSNVLRAIKLGERVGYPREVTPFQDSFGDLIFAILFIEFLINYKKLA